jgi:hypothetical protein
MVNRSTTPPLSGRLEVNITDSNLENLLLQLVPGADINGRVRVEDGDLQDILPQGSRGLPTAAAIAAGARIAVALSETEGFALSPNRLWPVQDDGTFQIQGARASTYSWDVAGLPEGTYVRSVRFGGEDVTRKAIDTTNGVGGTLEVVLSTKAAELSGWVTNDAGEPMAGVMVTLWPKTADPSNPIRGVKGATTDQNGTFRLSGLAPGDYYVAAWEEIDEPRLVSHPQFLARFNGEASAITLAESEHASANATLISSERILAAVARLP